MHRAPTGMPHRNALQVRQKVQGDGNVKVKGEAKATWPLWLQVPRRCIRKLKEHVVVV